MRHSAFFQKTDTPRFHASRTAILAALLGSGMILAPVASAQDATPAASASASPAAPVEADVTTIMQEEFEAFPRASMTMRLLRITLEPGASTPMHTHPGPEFDFIESGELTLETDGEAPITRANGDTGISSTDPLVLGAGDSVVYPAGTGMYYINDGEEPVVLLSAVILPVGSEFPDSITYTGGQPTSQDFEGVSFVVLGDGLLQNTPTGVPTVSINEVILPAGADLPEAEGVAMYSHVDGNFSFIVESGAVQVSRSDLEALQPNAVAGEEFILEKGDAAFFPAGVTATSRADETGTLELLTLDIEFDEPLTTDPATLTFTSGIGATGDATGGPETDVDGTEVEDPEEDTGDIGAIVTTNAIDINLRAEPATTADVVDQLADGVELEVIGGPEEGEDYVWYQVRVNVDGGSEGWLAADFLDGLDAAATEDTAADALVDVIADTETDEEPTPAPAAASTGPFASGDVVQTTEDIVRVRAEGNLGGDIVNTYPAGTQLVVTGDAVVADGFTWYPVTLVDDPSITGWTTEDFLAPAE